MDFRKFISKILIEKLTLSQNFENYIELMTLSFRYITGGPVALTSKLSEVLYSLAAGPCNFFLLQKTTHPH